MHSVPGRQGGRGVDLIEFEKWSDGRNVRESRRTGLQIYNQLITEHTIVIPFIYLHILIHTNMKLHT